MNNSYLVLEDGSHFPGCFFGHPPLNVDELPAIKTQGALFSNSPTDRKIPAGEVVFNTGMSGYHEILTDPSYSGQMICMTYPHIGNYGTDESWTEYGPSEAEPAKRLKACGMIVRTLYTGPVPKGRISLDQFMKNFQTTGISNIDTRRLTLHIRAHGSPRGVIVRAEKELTAAQLKTCREFLLRFPRMEGRNLVQELGQQKVLSVNTKGSPHISLLDTGVKANIIRELVVLGCKVSVLPFKLTAGDILDLKSDALLLSNGPGDPAVLGSIVEVVKDLLGKIPVFGICLGHQLISLALGAKSYKMKFGHHGINNPVRDEKTGKVQVTSQNHGFAIEEATLPPSCTVRFRNANDQTVEGIEDLGLPTLTAQFHPEAAPGPRDSLWIFQNFLELIK